MSTVSNSKAVSGYAMLELLTCFADSTKTDPMRLTCVSVLQAVHSRRKWAVFHRLSAVPGHICHINSYYYLVAVVKIH